MINYIAHSRLDNVIWGYGFSLGETLSSAIEAMKKHACGDLEADVADINIIECSNAVLSWIEQYGGCVVPFYIDDDGKAQIRSSK